MYRKVREYIRTWQMLGREDKVIAGISGGADSICLLFILQIAAFSPLLLKLE